MLNYSQYIVAGHIFKAHGLKGWVKAKVLIETFEENFNKVVNFHEHNLLIEKVTLFDSPKNIFLLKIKNVDNLEETEKYIGSSFFLHHGLLKSLPKNKFYLFNIYDRKVLNHHNKEIGYISNILDYGAGDIIEIYLNIGKVVYLPFDAQNFEELTEDNIVKLTEYGFNTIAYL